MGLALGPDQDHGGHQDEIQHQCQGDASGHHPAEINHRLDARHHQGDKGHNGGDAGVHTRNRHQLHRAQYPLVDIPVRFQRMYLTVADDQVNGDGQRDDQQYRDKVGRYHGHAPVQRTQQAQHHHHGSGAGYQRNNHPARPAEDQGQNQQHDTEDGRAEYHQVPTNKAHHIRRDHRYPADKNIGIGPVARGNLTHVGHHVALGIQGHRRMRLEGCLNLGELLLLIGRQALPVPLDAQGFPTGEQVVVKLVPLEIDLHSGELAIAAGEQVRVDRAGGQLLQHQVAVDAGLVQRGQRLRRADIGEGDRRAFQQGNIPDGDHGRNTLQLAQLIRHAAQRLQRLGGQ